MRNSQRHTAHQKLNRTTQAEVESHLIYLLHRGMNVQRSMKTFKFNENNSARTNLRHQEKEKNVQLLGYG